MRPTRTWVLAADQAKARIFAKEGPRGTFRNIEDEALESLNRAARDIMTARLNVLVSEHLG